MARLGHTDPVSERIEIPTDAGAMPAQLWLPRSGRGPGVVLVQEIFGVSGYIRRRAGELDDLGYVVLAPELFWRLGKSAVPEGPTMLEDAMALTSRLDWDAAVSDGAAAVRALRERSEMTGRVGVLGFCLGGGLGFNVAAVEPVDCLVSYYGSALPTLLELAPRVTCPSLHHIGESDSYLDAESRAGIREAVTAQGAEFHGYPGADHAFDNDDFVLFHADASAAAWERTAEFLHRTLPV